MAKVSVALCTYNGAEYLREQIESIFAQTVVPDEIIVTDDRSTDATAAILEEYAKTTSLRYVINDTQLGFVKNFEKAISLCSGEYIVLADQDDVWLPEKIEMLLNKIEDNLLVYSDAELVDSKLIPLGKRLLNPAKTKTIEGNGNNKAFVFGNCVSGNTMLFRKELADLALPIPADIPFHDAYLAFYASTCGAIQYVDKALVLYRQHGNNITDSAGLKKKKKRSKIEGKRESNRKRIAILRAFLKCSCLNVDDRNLLEKLLQGYEKYESTFFNFSLFRVLYQNQNEFFAIDAKKSFMRIVKAALGLNAYKIFPFL